MLVSIVRFRDWWIKPYSYKAIDGKMHETTTLRELWIAIVFTPIVLALTAVALVLFAFGVLAVDAVMFG